ncbi:MAG: prepilin peptidase [Halobacteriovoraceae bacterium]|nr:prepilin peptidase [Halobacteriovoraceae bacterium]
MAIPGTVFVILCIELLIIAYLDFRYKTIKNIWVFVNIFFGIVFFLSWPEYYFFQLNTFFFSATIFGVGLVFFKLKIMSAGDTKLLMTLFPLIPIDLQESYFITLLFGTVIIGGSVLFINIVKNYKSLFEILVTRNFTHMRDFLGSKFSFAPVVFIAWIVFGLANKTRIVF